jgi:hypothetical protein
MKSRDSILRLKRFDLAEKSRKVNDLEGMIREFDRMVVDLDRQIASEEDRTGIRDRAHFAYSTFAKSACQRRDNLTVSISDLRAKLATAVQARDEIAADVAATEASDVYDKSRTKPERTYSALMR